MKNSIRSVAIASIVVSGLEGRLDVDRPRGQQRLHALSEAAQVEQRQDLQVPGSGDLIADLDGEVRDAHHQRAMPQRDRLGPSGRPAGVHERQQIVPA